MVSDPADALAVVTAATSSATRSGPQPTLSVAAPAGEAAMPAATMAVLTIVARRRPMPFSLTVLPLVAPLLRPLAAWAAGDAESSPTWVMFRRFPAGGRAVTEEGCGRSNYADGLFRFVQESL